MAAAISRERRRKAALGQEVEELRVEVSRRREALLVSGKGGGEWAQGGRRGWREEAKRLEARLGERQAQLARTAGRSSPNPNPNPNPNPDTDTFLQLEAVTRHSPRQLRGDIEEGREGWAACAARLHSWQQALWPPPSHLVPAEMEAPHPPPLDSSLVEEAARWRVESQAFARESRRVERAQQQQREARTGAGRGGVGSGTETGGGKDELQMLKKQLELRLSNLRTCRQHAASLRGQNDELQDSILRGASEDLQM